MKEYNIIEVLKFPVGTKFKIKDKDISREYIIKWTQTNGKCLALASNSVLMPILSETIVNATFVEIKPQPFTFFEAMKLIDKGKKMYNEIYPNIVFHKHEIDGDLVTEDGIPNLEEREITGKWYVYEE